LRLKILKKLRTASLNSEFTGFYKKSVIREVWQRRKNSAWPSLTKDMQTEQLLCWNGMTDAEHSTTSGLNEVARNKYFYITSCVTNGEGAEDKEGDNFPPGNSDMDPFIELPPFRLPLFPKQFYKPYKTFGLYKFGFLLLQQCLTKLCSRVF